MPIVLEIPGGMISDADGAALRGWNGGPAGARIRVGRSFEDIATGRSGVITSFSSAGPTAYEHARRTCPRSGGRDPVVDASELRRSVRRVRRHEYGGAARRQRVALLQRHPSWSPSR